MATRGPNTINLLCLDQITLQDVPKWKHKLELFVGNRQIELETEDNQTWIPAQRPVVSPTSDIRVEIQAKRFLTKEHASKQIDIPKVFNEYGASKSPKLIVPEVVVVGKHTCSLELQFSPTLTTESLRLSIEELVGLLRNYSTIMSPSTEKALEKAIKFGAALSEFNDIAKAVFSVTGLVFEILKEQNKYDQMASGLIDRLQRIVYLAEKVADEIVCEETELLKNIVPRMFEVMQVTVKGLCDYVKRGRFGRMRGGLVNAKDNEMIEKMTGELADVIEEFMRAVDVETLRVAQESEHAILLGGLEYVKTGYHQDLQCMDGTRRTLLKDIMDWVANQSAQGDAVQGNIFWLYGLPGIGKTSLAHSICASLHDREQLAGAFFCRRDDVKLSEPRNILLTLTYKLARTFPAFRRVVAERLRNDPHLTSESMKDSHFLDFIRSVTRHPKHTLVIVVDALDECGDTRNRPSILKALTDATREASWLKIIITSRPEADIERFFDSLPQRSHLRRDLGRDEEASSDLRSFAQREFDLVASHCYLATPWPEEALFDRVLSRANGLFIFIKTLVLVLEHCKDPTVSLTATMNNSDSTGLNSLYGLYLSVLKTRIPPSDDEFQRVIGVLLTTSPYRPLREEAIAELAAVQSHLVKRWVGDLSSLLYRDDGANGGIRVRHLSISEFFVSDDCHSDYRVRLGDANTHVGIECLKIMINRLHFNICKLEDSRLANADVQDLESRIMKYIADTLQYSCLYWSNHLCFTPDNHNQVILRILKEFFDGLYPLFWIEVLSIMGAVPIGNLSLRKMISWVMDIDTNLRERMEDARRFVIAFHTPLSISAPHTYISTGPFLPSESPLSTIFNTWFTRGIETTRGKLVSWPAPPLEWIEHSLSCLSCSPDGCFFVTGSDNGTIRIWDAETGAAVGEPLTGDQDCGGVQSITYSPDGQHIVSGSYSGNIQIWDVKAGIAVGKPLEGNTVWVNSIAYSPNGQHIISGSNDSTIQIWDAETGAVVGKPLEGHTEFVTSVAYSPDGLWIISGSGDCTIRIWDARTGAAVGMPLEGHTASVQTIAYSPNGQHIISGSDDKSIRKWNAETGGPIGTPLQGHTGPVSSIAYSSDGQCIISGSEDTTIRIWDAATGAVVGKPLEGHRAGVRFVTSSPDGRHIISGSLDEVIRMWDAHTGAALGRPLEGHTDWLGSVAYSPDGQSIVSGSYDRTIRIWDAKTGAAVGKPLQGHTAGVQSIAYSPDGQHIISGSHDCTIRIWDARTGAAYGNPLKGHQSWVRSVAYSPGGQHIISGSDDKTVRIWDAETCTAVGNPLMGHTGSVMCVAYSPNGQHIISGSQDRTIRIWDAVTGAAVGMPLEGHTSWVRSIAYSPDGQHFISGSDDSTIRIWDAKTGVAVGNPLEGHTGHVYTIAYSPDGQHIISGSGDKTIRIWDAETGTAVGQPLKGHSHPVTSIAISPDGQYVVSGSRDSTIHVWALSPPPPIQLSSSGNPIYPQLSAEPDPDGWVRDPEGGLLYWVPQDCRTGLNSPALLTIPPTSHTRSVSLDFKDFAYGPYWIQIFNGKQS